MKKYTIIIDGLVLYFLGLGLSLVLIIAGTLLLPNNFPTHINVGLTLTYFGFLGIGLVLGIGSKWVFRDA